MNYIYDILLNFCDCDRLIEFYEWGDSDVFEHIKKMPIFRVKSSVIVDFCWKKIIIDKEFLEQIKGECISYKNKKDIKYGCLVCDLNRVIAIEFNSKGELISKSGLLLDEEEDTINECCDIKEVDLKYKALEENSSDYFLTREELFKKNYLLKELNYIKKVSDYDKLNYLYEEIFSSDKLSFSERVLKLEEDITNNYSDKYNKLYDVVRLTYKAK